MTTATPIFAFGISQLPMLGWLAAAGIPIVIHFWSRRRYREMPWAAMQYLLAALRRRQRRLWVEQWLLLAVRTLIVLLVVLAVAQPYLERSIFGLVAGQRTHHVLVIDGSYSMAYRPTDKSRFDQAKELAARIVEESPQADAFTLVLMAAPPRAVVGTPAFEAGEFLHEIENLRVAHTTADLAATLDAVYQVVANARRDHPRLARQEVVFLTDLGRVGWAPAPGSDAAARVRRRAEQLAQLAGLTVIDLGQPDAENLAVTALRAAEPIVTPGRAVHVQAEIRNFGRSPQNHRALELLVDGRRAAAQQVDVAAGGSGSVTFTCRFDTPGDHAIEARLESDRLDLDNHRWLSVPVRESLRVLCINGRPSGEPVGGAADYLVLALAARRAQRDPALVRPEPAPESALLERDLSAYDCIYLCNVAQFTASEAKLLDAYLASGGNLVFFLGDRVLPERYNRELSGQSPHTPRVLPARLGTVSAEGLYRVDPREYAHPVIRAFRGHERAGLLTTPVLRYCKLEVPRDSQARVVLGLTNGDPLIVEEPIRRGRVVLVATSADTTWTALPLWPSFVPIVQELLEYAVGGQMQQQNVEVGQMLQGTLAPAASAAAVVVQRPDGAVEPVHRQAPPDYSGWTYSETTVAGPYALRVGAAPEQNGLFAVNLDTAESDLSQLSVDELRHDVWPGVAFAHRTTWQHPERDASPRVGGRSTLHLGLLYVALGLVFLETYLAWRAGHHAT